MSPSPTPTTTPGHAGGPGSETRGGRIRALGVAVALVAVGLVGAGLVGAVPLVVELLVTGAIAADPVFGLASVVATMLGYAALGYGYARRYLGGLPARVPDARTLGLVGGATVLALALAAVLGALLTLAGVEAAPSGLFELYADTPLVLLALAGIALLVNGPAEEILFRGAVQGRLRRSFGPAGAVAVASLLFAAVHIVAVVGTLGAALASAGVILAVALVLGAVYELTDNIVVPSLVHGLYNATLLTIAYLSVTGAA